MNKIIKGDCLSVLQELDDDLIDCLITSPPYYGLLSLIPIIPRWGTANGIGLLMDLRTQTLTGRSLEAQ